MGDHFFIFFSCCMKCLKIHGTCSGCFVRCLLLLLLLWCDCFEAGFELLGSCLKGEPQCRVTYNPPWHFTDISSGKALVSAGMEKKIREEMASQSIHFKGGLREPLLPRCLQINFQCTFLTLHYTAVHHPSGLRQCLQASRSVTHINTMPLGLQWLNRTGSETGAICQLFCKQLIAP